MKRTPMRKISKKRAARRKSPEGQAAIAYMLEVKKLPCCACGAPAPSDSHHCRSGGMMRNDWFTIPLCKECHQGDNGYHMAKASWHAMHGPDYGFVPQTKAAVKAANLGRFDEWM